MRRHCGGMVERSMVNKKQIIGGQSMRVKANGNIYCIDQQTVENSLRDVKPNPGSKYFVEVAGASYPIRQALAASLGIPAIGLSTNHCYAVLSKIGFDIQEVNKN